jgi:hypothetical protein
MAGDFGESWWAARRRRVVGKGEAAFGARPGLAGGGGGAFKKQQQRLELPRRGGMK